MAGSTAPGGQGRQDQFLHPGIQLNKIQPLMVFRGLIQQRLGTVGHHALDFIGARQGLGRIGIGPAQGPVVNHVAVELVFGLGQGFPV